MFVDHVLRFDAQWSQFFAEFDWFVMLTSCLDAYISRYDDFCANDNDDDTTDYFTPYACMQGNNQPMQPGTTYVSQLSMHYI